MLFLLKNGQGKALLIAQAATQAEADAFGRNQLPEFCGQSTEIDADSQAAAEEFWGVRTVSVRNVTAGRARAAAAFASLTRIVVHGLELPEEVEQDDCLTAEDRRDLALDHIGRTSDVVAKIELRLWA